MFRIILILFIAVPLLASAQWEYLEPMPTPREGLAVAELDGKIYAIGGKNRWGYYALDVVEIYDISADEWFTGPPLLNPRIYSAAAVHDGKIFVFGGREGFWLVDEVEMFDPQVGHWIEVCNMYSREGLSATTYGDSIIVLGGKSSMWNYSSCANVFNPIALCWGDSLPSYPEPRAGHGAAVIGDSLFIVGGVGYWMLSDVSFYDGYQWQDGIDLPVELGNTGAAVIGNSIFAVGGNFDFQATNRAFQFCISNDNWIEIDTLNTAREYHGVIACNDKIYVIGGGEGDYFDRDYLSSMEVLDMTNCPVFSRENDSKAKSLSIASYPNPFSQYTEINIDSPNEIINPLIIYNILGREVMRWSEPDWRGGGQLSIIWNGSDNFGNPLPAGVYFLRLNTTDSDRIQKITIIR